MKSSEDRILVCINFPITANAVIIKLFEDLQKEFIFDIMYHKIFEPIVEFYGGYSKILICFHAEIEEDFIKLREEYKLFKDKLPRIDQVILSSTKINCEIFLSDFQSEISLDLSCENGIKNSKRLLRDVIKNITLINKNNIDKKNYELRVSEDPNKLLLQ